MKNFEENGAVPYGNSIGGNVIYRGILPKRREGRLLGKQEEGRDMRKENIRVAVHHRVVSRALNSLTVLATSLVLASTLVAGGAGASAPAEEPSTKPERLIVRTWGGPWQSTYAEGAAASFTKKTGIPVELDLTDYNEIQVKVRQAVSAGRRPPVDVVLTTQTLAFAAQVQNISAPLDQHLLTNLGDLSSLAMPKGAANYINVSTYSQPVIYNPKEVSLPDNISWQELFDDKYAGRLFVTNTYPSLLYPVAKMLGLDVQTDDLTPAFDKIAELRNGIAATGDEEEFIAAVEAREVVIGVTLVATALEVDGLKWIVPKEGATVQSESFWIPKDLPDGVAYWAQVFVNETLSAANQAKIASGIGEVPVNLKATIPDFMRGDPAFPFTDEDIAKYGIIVPVEFAAQNQDRWQSAYTAAIQQ
jgi:spermidine/putrescine-binding protein